MALDSRCRPRHIPLMHITTEAIVCAVRAHGENGVVARLMTPHDGLQPGYVRGGRSRRLRPVLLAGNVVQAEYRARTDEQLAALTVELAHSRAGLHGEPLAAAAIDWATALTATTLPEGQAYPRLHAALDGLLAAVEAAPGARGWAAALVRYELLILSELGFGADLPPGAAGAELAEVLDALRGTGHLIERDLLDGRRARVLAARERLVERLKRMTA